MKLLFLLSLIGLFFQNNPKKIIIDIKNVNQLELSLLSEKVISVPLKTNKYSFPNIDKVFLVNDNIYVLNIYEEDGTVISQVLKFDLTGNFKEQIGEKETGSNEFLRVYDMKYDEGTRLIHIVYSDGNGVYDEDGNLKVFYNRNDKSHGFRSVQEVVHQGKVWRLENFSKDGFAYYDIVQTDLYGQNKNSLKTLKFKISDGDLKLGIERYHLVHFSIHANEVYISCGMDNTIYKIINNKLSPEYIVEFRNQSQPADYIFSAPKQVIIGRYLVNEYWDNWMQYDFIYDTETNHSYNVRIHLKSGIVNPGIIDDLFKTGFFALNRTNTEDYIYFVKKPEEMKGTKIYDPGQTNPTIFLIKLK